MKNSIITVVALASTAGLAAAQATHTFDLSGIGVDGGLFDNMPTLTHNFGGAGYVSQIEFNVTYDAFFPSWMSEVAISFDTDGGTPGAIGLGDFYDIFMADYGAPSTAGTFSASDTIAVNLNSSDGLVWLTLWDSFQDAGVNPDAIFRDGSYVTVTYIPAPGAMALMGLGGLAAARRRR